jgi:hypothetical protein
MDGDIDLAFGERFLDFLRKETLAADVGEWPVADTIAAGADRDDLDHIAGKLERGDEALARLFSLGEGERRAACADAKDASLQILGSEW